MQKLLTFFSKKFQHIWVSLDVNFNKSLTNDVVSFEQLGPAGIPALHFDVSWLWTVCLVDDSHEMLSLIFSEK